MRARGSLYAKLLLWLLLNLLLIAALFVAIPGRSGIGWSVLLSQPVRERLLTVGERIGRELSAAQQSGWPKILQSYDDEYGVHFAADLEPPGPVHLQPPLSGFAMNDHGDADFTVSAGPPGEPPLRQFGGPPPGPPAGPPRPPPPEGPEQFPGGPGIGLITGGPALMKGGGLVIARGIIEDRHARANLIAISHPGAGYEVRIPALLEAHGGNPPRPLHLHAYAPSLVALLRFLGVTEWLLFTLLVLGLSLLLWWPFIWGITRTLVQVTRATQDIAAGRFETRVRTRRRDELGRLADSVNQMAGRLQNFVSGQKQFLADIAHEVTSPLARMQFGLGVLESRVGPEVQGTVREVQEVAQEMSRLLEELLLYSRAGIEAERAPAGMIELAPLAAEVLRREDPAQRVQIDITPGLRCRAHAALLERALANLVRNALRYAGDAAEPVRLSAAAQDGVVLIAVRDRGPGVPEEALPRLGEPFFRPALARERDSGGSGLGLAIVRRCVEACGGSVVFRNREGGGFEVVIRLQAA
jgi:two-component system, OmpR family, sensor histidine kinase CpxA